MSGRRGNNFGFRGRRSRGKDYSEQGPSDDGPSRLKHPKHLKGKEIGLWYAKNKTPPVSTPINVGTVLMSEETRTQLKSFLNTNVPVLFQTDDKTYNHVANSSFKHNFLQTISGNINDKLKTQTLIPHNYELDKNLQEEFEKKRGEYGYKQMLGQRRKLPAYEMRGELMRLIESNQVCVISGETGCGKTTQVAQFILDSYLESGNGSICRIVCSQPRRISAISVAERVAEERAEVLGKSVGYHIRLEKKLPRERGSISFCTTGVILKQLESDITLNNVSHLILDEIHERDVMTDFLITLMARVLKCRPDIKLILMSATLNAKKFAKYFNVSSILEIPGFTYEVEEFFLEDVLLRTNFQFARGKRRRFKDKDNYTQMIMPHVRNLEAKKLYPSSVCRELMKWESEEMNLELISELIMDICRNEKDMGAILVFLTGFSEINSLNKILKQSKDFPPHQFLIIPLHSQLPTIEQKYIFKPAPSGVRKIILSTNIAETSITINDVVFVIDCGKIKMSNFKVESNQQTLLPEWVSSANANQRRGRAGRVQPGKCYHLYSKARHMELDSYQTPEILRKRLDDVILMLKLLQLGKAEEFLASLMDAPEPEAIKNSLDLLMRLNALDEDENLTPLGYHLARLPVAPQIGKMILLSAVFSCLDPILSIAASLDFKDPFLMPLGAERKVDRIKYEFAEGVKSDHIILHKALEKFYEADDRRSFCWENYLSFSTMNMLGNMKRQFAEYLHELNFLPNSDPKFEGSNKNSNNLSLVKAIICGGLYPNVALIRSKVKTSRVVNSFRLLNRRAVKLHPKSILNRVECFESPVVVYYLKVKSTSDFLHDATMVYPLPLIFFGDRFAEHDEEKFSISINGLLRFKCSQESAGIIKELRNRLNWFLEYKVSHPGFVNWSNDEEVETLRAIMELITNEDIGVIDLDAYDDFD